jgi:hypothetical protein
MPLKPFNPISPHQRGLGDTVAKVASALNIKPTKDCGCEKRQELLNKLVPYPKKGAR